MLLTVSLKQYNLTDCGMYTCLLIPVHALVELGMHDSGGGMDENKFYKICKVL